MSRFFSILSRKLKSLERGVTLSDAFHILTANPDSKLDTETGEPLVHWAKFALLGSTIKKAIERQAHAPTLAPKVQDVYDLIMGHDIERSDEVRKSRFRFCLD